MLDWLANRWNDSIDFIWRIVLSLFDMLKDFFIWIVETLMDGAILLIDGLSSLLGGISAVGGMGMLPAETAGTLSQIGLTEAVGMIVVSLSIRFLLQLIPFVRWGS